ncbi:4-(cytidine 5'-diphospho)-2-C-methyl-D-erythritol kinase [Aliivibrio salmonicida]|uniref:4-diphosphocytidyl-2-C-methyl-D-erythritol kinase n=1 Tax=Aliivibrio salmonicida (strain LFI1238) TaxID=316275 RepID=ISPE_ALISL|nr:4-(cytidine 5'-diphospho)-2-C-methyl-D-erythritol kinase [Aliivibrio salmonicida]B6EHH2.1 RecName: Full=4-diphosphocytidyl-2-C-methyl-D-erythritol kinase; Short=CMK; AltName: Full=4-(cytidine-5'-diphospho)-2-C-methyl-D-erythritol kinase [Aliivibrio salmonicida LFI1238]AZL84256.1 4-(cytidine 5'-diphospho)-2-C-methyl-D-erythritol kinase [Aliivibrio salmonicida]CAQ78472.1 4-diphosphocytidyl-2-C-methyl-D-erythritol kinase [Aliivibrio salmonicida LFI1238]
MITTATRWPSPAKLNLFLYINGQHDNGYHELQTLFQFIDLCDHLTITPNDSGEITLSPPIPGVEKKDNLIWKAATQLQEHTLCPLGAHIELEKILPIGGGIGGGSSNAATTLVALNFLWDLNLTNKELADLGVTLGADVPIFVHGFSAFAEGIGEKLQPANPKELWYVLIKPEVSIATVDVFSHPELIRNTAKQPLNVLLSASYENDCEKIVRRVYPEVDYQLSWLLEYAPSRLTGTGACVFAEFINEKEAQHVFSLIPDNATGFITRGRNTSPLNQALEEYKSLCNI